MTNRGITAFAGRWGLSSTLFLGLLVLAACFLGTNVAEEKKPAPAEEKKPAPAEEKKPAPAEEKKPAALEQPAALPAAPFPFPDLSDPKAAAFSLAIAIEQADVKAARAAYAGKQELFLEYLDALARTKAKADRLQRAITARYGASAGRSLAFPLNAELQIAADDGTRIPLSMAVALAEVKQQGDVATLPLNKDLAIRLRKSEVGWQVTDFPGPSPLGFLTFQMADKFLDRFTAEVDQGKHKKPYELAAVAWRLRVHPDEGKESPKDEGKKDDKK